MGKYKVVFSYSVDVEAEDGRDAEDMAWELFGKADPSNTDEFACTVEYTVDPWATDSHGYYTCVDCDDDVTPDAVLGDRKFGEPRCEGCYDSYRYGA
jgi:hypothetical protein